MRRRRPVRRRQQAVDLLRGQAQRAGDPGHRTRPRGAVRVRHRSRRTGTTFPRPLLRGYGRKAPLDPPRPCDGAGAPRVVRVPRPCHAEPSSSAAAADQQRDRGSACRTATTARLRCPTCSPASGSTSCCARCRSGSPRSSRRGGGCRTCSTRSSASPPGWTWRPRCARSWRRRSTSSTPGTAPSACSARPAALAVHHVGYRRRPPRPDGAPARGQGPPRPAHHRPAPAADRRPGPAPRLGRLPAAPPADAHLPRGARPGRRRGVRQPVPDREAAAGEFTAEDEVRARRPRRRGRHRHRQRPALRAGRMRQQWLEASAEIRTSCCSGASRRTTRWSWSSSAAELTTSPTPTVAGAGARPATALRRRRRGRRPPSEPGRRRLDGRDPLLREVVEAARPCSAASLGRTSLPARRVAGVRVDRRPSRSAATTCGSASLVALRRRRPAAVRPRPRVPLMIAFADQATLALDMAAAAGPPAAARRLRRPRPDRPRPARPRHPAAVRRRPELQAHAAGACTDPAVAAAAPAGGGPARRDRPGHPHDDLRPAHHRRRRPGDSLRRRCWTWSTEAAPAAACTPSVRMSGAVDTLVTAASSARTWWPWSGRGSATPRGTRGGTAHVTVTLDVGRRRCVVDVVDDGIGHRPDGGAQRPAQPRASGRERAAASSTVQPRAARRHRGCAGTVPRPLIRRWSRCRRRQPGSRADRCSSVAQHRRLGAALEAELGQQGGHVVLDRLLGEEHPLTDLPVGQPLGDELEDACAPARLSRPYRARPARRPAQPLQHRGGGRRVQQRPAGGDGAHGADEVLPVICLSR